MEQSGSILGTVLKKMDLDEIAQAQRLPKIWRDVAGPLIADRSRTEGLRNGVLTIRVEGSVWVQELGFYKARLVDDLNKRGLRVRDIRFRSGALGGSAPGTGRRQTRSLSPEDRALVESVGRKFDDPRLRTDFQRLLATALGTPRGETRRTSGTE